MLSESCLRYREEFRGGPPEGHANRCAPCAEWVRWVTSLQAAGADLPLPAPVRAQILALSDRGTARGIPAPLEPLPQVPLPSGLMARLYRIPEESRMAGARKHPPAGSGEMVAASLLVATLLTFGLGNVLSPGDRPDLGAAARVTGAVLREAGSRGTQTLLGVGERIFDGCIEASRSLEHVLGRVGDPWRESRTEPRAPEASPKTPPHHPAQGKETTHGSSKAP